MEVERIWQTWTTTEKRLRVFRENNPEIIIKDEKHLNQFPYYDKVRVTLGIPKKGEWEYSPDREMYYRNQVIEETKEVHSTKGVEDFGDYKVSHRVISQQINKVFEDGSTQEGRKYYF